MSNITKGQLQELHQFANERRAEFGNALPSLSIGTVRLVYDASMEWREPQDKEARDATYKEGWENGRLHGYYEATQHMHSVMERLNQLEADYRAKRASDIARTEMAAAAAAERDFRLVRDADGRTVERVPWEADKAGDVPYTNGNHVVHGDEPTHGVSAGATELGEHWPDMPNIEGGVDRFAEHPIAGEPEPSPEVAAVLGPEHTTVTPLKPAASHPWKSRVDGRPNNPLPDPDVAREKVAHAIAHGSGALVEAIRKPRTLAEVDALPQKPHKGRAVPSPEQVIAELQRQAMGGVMPSMDAFDAARPANWSRAQAHMVRMGTSWGQLAKLAGLRLRGDSE